MAVSDLSVADVTDTERPLQVAMVAPPYFAVPPSGYGGIEAVVAGLVDGLVERGHRVTLLAAGRHGTRAQQFLSTAEVHPADRLGEALPEVVNAARVDALIGTGSGFDLVHDHTLAGPLLATGRSVPTVVTVHGPLSDLADVYRPGHRAAGLVAISHDQRRAAPDLNWLATVHNGVDVASYPFNARKGDYCLFLGRFHPDKAPHLAIDAARAAGRRILLAGKCSEPVEQRYYDSEVAPRLGPDAVNVGVADHDTKRELLTGARCLVGGAVRHGARRGHGVRHACRRPGQRCRAGGGGPRDDGPGRARSGGPGRRHPPRLGHRPGRVPAPGRVEVQHRGDGRRL